MKHSVWGISLPLRARDGRQKSYINTGPFPRSFRLLISTKTIHPANQMMVPVEKLKRRRRSLPLMNNIMLKYICEHGKCWVFQFLCSKWRNWSTCHDGSWPLRTLIRCKSLVDSLRRYEWRKTLYRSQRPARPSYIAKFVSYLVVIRWYRNLCFSPDSIGALLVLLGCVSFGPFASSLDGTFFIFNPILCHIVSQWIIWVGTGQ